MKLLHAINAAAWLGNAVVWFFYAHVTPMAAIAAAAMLLSVAMWRLEP